MTAMELIDKLKEIGFKIIYEEGNADNPSRIVD